MHRCKISTQCTSEMCPSFRNCFKIPTEIYLDDRDKPVDVLFIISLSEDDNRNKYLLSSKTGNVFKELINHIETKELGKFVNKAFLPITRIASNNPEVMNCCKEYLLRDIDKIKPKTIVTVGTSATATLFPDNPSIKTAFIQNKSFFREFKYNGRKYPTLPIFSASRAYDSPAILCSIAEDLRRIFGVYTFKPMVSCKSIEEIKNLKEAKELVLHLKNLKNYEAVAVDTECLNLKRRYGNFLDSIQFCYDPKKAYFMWVGHPNSPFDPEEQKELKRYLRYLFHAQCSFKYWIMHNAKFDMAILLSKLGVRPFNPVICTMMFSFVIEENYMDTIIGSYALKYLSKKFGFNDYDKEALEARAAGDLRNLSAHKYIEYAANDVVTTIQLYYILKNMASGQNYLDNAMRLMTHFYNRVFRLLVEMEYNGINVDFEKLLHLESDESPINQRMDEIISKDFRNLKFIKDTNDLLVDGSSMANPLFGKPWVFDINKVNHKQLLYFYTLGLKPLGTTKVKDKDKKGNIIIAGRKVPAGALNKLFQDTYSSVKEVELLAEYNQLKKLKTSYIQSIKKYLDEDSDREEKRYEDYWRDKRIRPSFHLTAKTGRGRATDPNSQQIPRGDTPIKKAIKNLYCAPIDHAIVSLDYMAIEVRGWGALANDLAMRDIFIKARQYRKEWRETGSLAAKEKAAQYGDIHTVNASIMFDVPIDKVGKLRQDSKPLTFGAIYAMSDKSLAIKMKCEVEEAVRRKEKVFSRFVESGKWLDDIEELGSKQLYVEHPLGRRRRLWEFLLGGSWEAKAKRLARNCVDYKTEILTENGWKKKYELVIGEKVLTKNLETSLLEWQEIEYIHDYPDYEGVLYNIKSKSFSTLCTPNHRWPVYNKTTKRNELREISKISVYGDHRIHRTGIYEKEDTKWTDTEIALIGWIVTDAHFRKHDKWNLTSIEVGQSKENNKPIIDSIFAELDYPFSKTDENRKITEKTYTNWHFSGDLAIKIRRALPNRTLTPEFLLSLSSKQLEVLCNNIVLGDGWRDNKTGARRVCAETEYEANMLQMLFVLMGKSASAKYYEPTKKEYRIKNTDVIIRPTKGVWVLREHKRDEIHVYKKDIVREFKKEPVWCITVKNNTFVARKDGQTYISGNSPIQGFASDITFLGASILLEKIIKDNRNWKFINAVHDAIYLQVPIDEVKECVLTSEKYFTDTLFEMVERDFGYKIPFPLEAEFEIGIYGGQLAKWDFSEKQLDSIVDSIREENEKRKNIPKAYSL